MLEPNRKFFWKRLPQLLYPPAWPIAAKLSAALLLAALLPMSFTACYNLRRSLVSLESSEYQNLELLALSTANRIDQLLTDTQRVAAQVSTDRSVVDFLSTIPNERESLQPTVQETLENVIHSNPDYYSVFLLDTEGTCLASTNPKNVGEKYSFRNYFQQAIRGQPYISELATGTTTKRPGIYLSVPVQDKRGRIVGVAVIKLQGETIWAIIDELHLGNKGSAFLIDEYGVIVSHSDRSLLYHSLTPLSKEILNKGVFVKRFSSVGIEQIQSLDLPDLAKAMVRANRQGHANYDLPHHQSRQIVGFAPIAKKPWVLGVNKSEEQFSAPLNRLVLENNLSVLIVGGITASAALLLARSIVNPILALTRAARSLEQGNFATARVDVNSSDEIGKLAGTFNMMVVGLRERQRERDIFGRVVSPEVREKLLEGKLELGGETRWVAVLFSDIRGFSTISEKKSPQELVAFLNEYLQEMTDAIRSWDGYINNFIGDAIVAVFGAPVSRTDAEWRAVAAALTMRQKLKDLNERRAARGEAPIESGIGISTGEVVAGQVGSLERMLYTVIGDAVNVAARLETLTKEYPDYPILINEQTAEALKQHRDIALTDLGPIKVKGRYQPVNVYAVTNGRKSPSGT